MPAPRCTRHARTLAAEIGFDLVDTFDRRRLRRQFHRTAYGDARRPRRRRRGRAYPLRADVHFVDRAAGAAVASAVSDAAMSVATPRSRTIATHRPTTASAAHPHGSFFGRRKGHKLRSHQADLIEHLLPRLALDIDQLQPVRSRRPVRCRGPTMSGSKSDLAAANI